MMSPKNCTDYNNTVKNEEQVIQALVLISVIKLPYVYYSVG